MVIAVSIPITERGERGDVRRGSGLTAIDLGYYPNNYAAFMWDGTNQFGLTTRLRGSGFPLVSLEGTWNLFLSSWAR